MAQQKEIDKIRNVPCAFVIFGATGDLSRKKIFPSLFQLHKNNLLPQNFKILAAARSRHTTDDFLEIIKESIENIDESLWQPFSKLVEYLPADIGENKNLGEISNALDDFEEKIKACPQRILYMSVSPTLYENAFENLGRNKLNLGCQKHNCKARIVTEKPFGLNFVSAQKLNTKLSEYFEEEQIYRIDHFLGKETVQNIFALRFANEIFEPLWNNKYVDHVQITGSEYIGVDKRGETYDQSGALRDFVQNHLLQLLTMVTMEEPKNFNRESIRERKIEILNSLKKMSEEEVIKNTVRGQYEGYTNEEKVDAKSQTETFAALKLFIENERWRGVPFYLRTGKKMVGKVTSIIFFFKETRHEIFKNFWQQPLPNHITIQIDPTEGVGIRLVAKKPGLAASLEPVDMEFCYKTSFTEPNPTAYERLLMDVIIGDQTLFLGKIGASWNFIDPIREVWDKGKPKLASYKQGTWGPHEADKLIEGDGRKWLAPFLTICKI